MIVIRHLEQSKKTGEALRFGKTLLRASYNSFLMSVVASVHEPGSPSFAMVEEKRKALCN